MKYLYLLLIGVAVVGSSRNLFADHKFSELEGHWNSKRGHYHIKGAGVLANDQHGFTFVRTTKERGHTVKCVGGGVMDLHHGVATATDVCTAPHLGDAQPASRTTWNFRKSPGSAQHMKGYAYELALEVKHHSGYHYNQEEHHSGHWHLETLHKVGSGPGPGPTRPRRPGR